MRIIQLLLLIFLAPCAIGQTKTIKGTLNDKAEKVNLVNASISLIRAKDSTLFTFTRAKADGSFEIPKPDSMGKYVLLVTHPKYADLIDTVTIAENLSDFGSLAVISKRIAYEQVIVKAKLAPIKIKGDTVIYTADSFKVREGANVEALLKKLPGIQVGRNGEITAMGETVKKVLVDGEEFFGDDPGVAIKNLRADAVDKVEVFDKKSDQAAFTGIDDGEKSKTINLKLKENKKKGYFGKVEGSGGLPDNYNAQAMINAFKAKRKISAYTLMGNTGSTNLGWNDAEKFGGSDDSQMNTEDGFMWRSQSSDEFTDFYGGANGIPKNWNGGLHYSNKFNGEKQSLNLGYKYNKVNTNGENRTFSKNFFKDSITNENSGTDAFSSKQRNQLNATIETKLDSFNVLKFTFKGSEQSSVTTNNSFNELFTTVGSINGSNRKTTNNAKGQNMEGSILWMRKFKKMGRSVSINMATKYNQTESDGFLYSLNRFYTNGVLSNNDTIDQEKIRTGQNTNLSSRIAYTEPLNKKIIAELSYSINLNNNDNNQKSLDRDASGKYNVLATRFSNNFSFKTTVHTPGLSFRYSKKKTTVNIGTKLGFNQFNQTDLTTNNKRTYNFTNFFPNAGVNFKLKGTKGLNINYNGRGSAPTLNQLQPIQDNNDPFNIVEGNPDLKQSFSHAINGNFNMWNVLKENSIWSYFSFSTTNNAYTNFSRYDASGRRISKTVNVNGNYNFNSSFNYGFKVKKLDLRLGLGPSLNFSNRNDFVSIDPNTILKNNSKTSGYGLSVNFSRWKENKFEFWSNFQFMQNNNKASVNKASQANFRSINGNVNFGYYLPWKLYINTELTFEARQKDPRFPKNNNFALWNASLKKDIIKDVFSLQFEVKDMLNQNRGFDRSFDSFNYTESFYKTLRRYWLLTATFNFNSQKPKKGTDEK
jgi:Outer membrane protein beta-barrel family